MLLYVFILLLFLYFYVHKYIQNIIELTLTFFLIYFDNKKIFKYFKDNFNIFINLNIFKININ